MPQRINTLRRKTTNRNDTNQMRAVSAAPVGGLNKCVSMLNPGLAPWAMQEYRPYRALLYSHQLQACSDTLIFVSSLIKCWLILMRLLSRPPNEMLTYLRMDCWVLWCGVVLFSIFVAK